MNPQKNTVLGFTQFDLSKITIRNINSFKLTIGTKLVLLAIIDRMPNCYISQTTLAKQLGIGEATVKRAIKELKEQGIISTEENKQTNTLNYSVTNKVIPISAQKDTKDSIKMIHKETTARNKKRNDFSNFQSKGITYPKYEPITLKMGAMTDDFRALKKQLGIK